MNRISKALRVLAGTMDATSNVEPPAPATLQPPGPQAPVQPDAGAIALAEALAKAPPAARGITTYSLRRK